MKSFRFLVSIFFGAAVASTGCSRHVGTGSGQSNGTLMGLENITFAKLGRDHSIDEYLDLVFHQKYRLEMAPVIQRPQAGASHLVKESIVSGKFRLRGMLLANPDEAVHEFVSSFDIPVEARFGKIIVDVKFSYTFRELPLVASRNRLVLELSELPEGLHSVLEAPFTTGVETGALMAVPSQQTFDSIAAQALQEGAASVDAEQVQQVLRQGKISPVRPKETPLELFHLVYGLAPIPDEFLQSARLQEHDLAELLEIDVATPNLVQIRRLCDLFFPRPEAEMARSFLTDPENTMIGRCRKRPLDFLHYAATKHVHGITSAPVVSWSNGPNIRVSASFVREAGRAEHSVKDAVREFSRRQHGWETSVKKSFRLPVSIGTPELSFETQFGWQWGKEWFNGYQVDETVAESNQFQAIEFHNLTISDLAVAMRARTQRCFFVGKKDWTDQSYYYCEPEIREEQIEEHWYYVFEWFQDQSNPLRDTRVLAERPWTKLIRGKYRYDAFRDMVLKKGNTFVLLREEPVPHTAEYLQRTFFQSNSFNGHIFDDNFPGRLY